ncbi:MAG: putative porin [Steroidobacteraceae bacterium]
MQSNFTLKLTTLAVMIGFSLSAQAQTANQQTVNELRNTLVSVMEALVQKGLITREQAAQIVSNAQADAEKVAKENAAQEAAEKNAIVVTRIPESIKQDIAKQVGAELRPLVKQDVLDDAQAKKWGVPGAMPEWLSRIKLSGDIRVRVQNDSFAAANIANTYLNYSAINTAGGVTKAGEGAFLNVTEDRLRERLRLRLALDAKLTDGISARVRLATGSLSDPVSPNQTLGQSGNRYQFAVDQAYLHYELMGSSEVPWLTSSVGRLPSPWLSTDLVWDPDFQFEGVATTWRYISEKNSTQPHNLFMTLGAFPLQEFELSPKDKWLYGAQLGADLPWDGGGRLQLAGAYYYYDNITGQKNAVDSALLNYTAPQFMQKGNTVFDILNDTSTDTYLYALAGKYHLVDAIATLDLPVLGHQVSLTADYVKNLGFKQQDVLKQFGYSALIAAPESSRLFFDARTAGWQVQLAVGTRQTGKKGNWRSEIGYKYLERDAVLDAFTDSDFHLGGTGAKGYTLRSDWWFKNNNWLSVKYFSSDEISRTAVSSSGSTNYVSTAPFAVDTVMLDINGQF